MRDKPQDHNWIPQFFFEFTNYDKAVMIILYCPHCQEYRYQYGKSLIYSAKQT